MNVMGGRRGQRGGVAVNELSLCSLIVAGPARVVTATGKPWDEDERTWQCLQPTAKHAPPPP